MEKRNAKSNAIANVMHVLEEETCGPSAFMDQFRVMEIVTVFVSNVKVKNLI